MALCDKKIYSLVHRHVIDRWNLTSLCVMLTAALFHFLWLHPFFFFFFFIIYIFWIFYTKVFFFFPFGCSLHSLLGTGKEMGSFWGNKLKHKSSGWFDNNCSNTRIQNRAYAATKDIINQMMLVIALYILSTVLISLFLGVCSKLNQACCSDDVSTLEGNLSYGDKHWNEYNVHHGAFSCPLNIIFIIHNAAWITNTRDVSQNWLLTDNIYIYVPSKARLIYKVLLEKKTLM